MITTDLRNGNYLAIIKSDKFLEVIINCLGPTSCDLMGIDGKDYRASYNQIYPIKITKRWLKDNDFNCTNEIDGENEENIDEKYIHRTLPIVYSKSDHRLFIYGHLFPVKIKYVHHLQNALIDCGIEFIPIIKESHYTQYESIPILELLGGLRKRKEFFDTNIAFGLSGMPKFNMVSSGNYARTNNKDKNRVDNESFRSSFVYIDGVGHPIIHSILRYLWDEQVVLDKTTGRSITLFVEKYGDDRYRFKKDPLMENHSEPFSWKILNTFINNFNEYIRGDYDIGIIPLNFYTNSLECSDRIKKSLLLGNILTDYAHYSSRASMIFIMAENWVSIKNARTGFEIPEVSRNILMSMKSLYSDFVSFGQVTTADYESIRPYSIPDIQPAPEIANGIPVDPIGALGVSGEVKIDQVNQENDNNEKVSFEGVYFVPRPSVVMHRQNLKNKNKKRDS